MTARIHGLKAWYCACSAYKESLVSIAAIDPNDDPTANEVFDDLREESYITSTGNRGIKFNNSEFGALADILFNECGWEPFEIRMRLKHYEGWDQHDWA